MGKDSYSRKNRGRVMRGPGPMGKYNPNRIIKRDGGSCVYCGASEELNVDHVIPKSRAGEFGLTRGEVHSDSNLVASCLDCNNSKKNLDVVEFLGVDAKKIGEFLRRARFVNDKIKKRLVN